jgi:dienelactone hydrolase
MGLLGVPAVCQEVPATQNGWDAAFFKYERTKLAVEETTPTAAQADVWRRPGVLPKSLAAPVASGTGRPLKMAGMDVVRLRFRDALDDDVPALLCKPAGKEGPFPVVIALHGVNSHKAQMCGQVAPALTKRGFAVLAFDMPLHGERPGRPSDVLDLSDLHRTFTLCRQAVVDLRQCIDLAEARLDLDTSRGVVLAGYSLGALIDTVAGAADARVKAMLLMVGGTPEFPAALSLVPEFCSLQPQKAIAHFAGRPLLMLNGSADQTITRDMGQRLFDAAAEPKQQRWYDCGHLLPARAYEDGAEWVARTWRKVGKS